MTITVYTFEDAAGNEYGCWHTQDYEQAKAYARLGRLRIIANAFEWSDSEMLDDFTRAEDKEEEAEEEAP